MEELKIFTGLQIRPYKHASSGIRTGIRVSLSLNLTQARAIAATTVGFNERIMCKCFFTELEIMYNIIYKQYLLYLQGDKN